MLTTPSCTHSGCCWAHSVAVVPSPSFCLLVLPKTSGLSLHIPDARSPSFPSLQFSAPQFLGRLTCLNLSLCLLTQVLSPAHLGFCFPAYFSKQKAGATAGLISFASLFTRSHSAGLLGTQGLHLKILFYFSKLYLVSLFSLCE